MVGYGDVVDERAVDEHLSRDPLRCSAACKTRGYPEYLSSSWVFTIITVPVLAAKINEASKPTSRSSAAKCCSGHVLNWNINDFDNGIG